MVSSTRVLWVNIVAAAQPAERIPKLSSFSLCNEIDWSGNKSSFFFYLHNISEAIKRVRATSCEKLAVVRRSDVLCNIRCCCCCCPRHRHRIDLLRHANTRTDSSFGRREMVKKMSEREEPNMPLIRWLIHDFMILTNRLFRIKVFSLVSILMCQQRPQFGECNVVLLEILLRLALFVYALTHIDKLCFFLFFQRVHIDGEWRRSGTPLFMGIACFIFGIQRIPLNEFSLVFRIDSIPSSEMLCVTLFTVREYFVLFYFSVLPAPKININFKPVRTSHPSSEHEPSAIRTKMGIRKIHF